MSLSAEDREAMRQRAAGLRDEVSSLVAAREAAEQGLSQDVEDVRLLAEIQALEAQKLAAKERLDAVTVDADTATQVMEAAAARQLASTADADPTGSSPANAAINNDTVLEPTLGTGDSKTADGGVK